MKKEISQSPLPPSKKSSKVVVNLSLPNAIQAVVNGNKVRRSEWLDQEEHCLLKDSYLKIYRGGIFYAWIISEGDLMATDWLVIKQDEIKV
jgi:hypothetical protein